MLKVTVFTVIAAACTLCEASDFPLQSLDLSGLLKTLQKKIDHSQDKEQRQRSASQHDDENVKEYRYGALTDLKLQELLNPSKNEENYKYKSKDHNNDDEQGIIKIEDVRLDDKDFLKLQGAKLDDKLQKLLQVHLPKTSKKKTKKRGPLNYKNDDRRIRDDDVGYNQRIIHQILDKEDNRVRKNKKQNRNDDDDNDRAIVNDQLSRHILSKLLNHEKSKASISKTNRDEINLSPLFKIKQPMREQEDEVMALLEESSDEDRNDRNDDEVDLNDYSKVYVVLNSEAVKSSKNKNKINELLSRLLSAPPPRSNRERRGKKTYKGFLIDDDAAGSDLRRGGGAEGVGETLDGDGGNSKPRKLRSSEPRGGRGGGGRGRGERGAGRQREEGSYHGGGGGRGSGGGGRGGGGGGGRGGHTAIPYMSQRGDIFERD